MPRYKHLPRPAQKTKRDEFVSLVDHAAHFIAKNKNYFLAALLALAVGWFGHGVFERQKQKNLAAQLARLPLIQAELKEGNAEKALKEMDALSGRLPSFLDTQLRVGKAHLLWDQGKLDEALNALEPLAKQEDSPMGSYPRFLKAQILEEMGKSEEAVKIYEALADASTQDGLVREWARGRLAVNHP